jgi:cytochrome c5
LAALPDVDLVLEDSSAVAVASAAEDSLDSISTSYKQSANTCHGNGDDQIAYSNDDQDQRDKQTVCINTVVNHVGPGFVSMPIIPNFNPQDNDDHKQPGKEVAICGNGGSGGAGRSGGEGGQGAKNVGDITSTSKVNDQIATVILRCFVVRRWLICSNI